MDELSELRALWHRHPAPPAFRTLDDEDDLTQVCVAWMRAAWSQVPVPAAPSRVRPLRSAPLAVVAAAATVLVTALAVWGLAHAAHAPTRHPDEARVAPAAAESPPAATPPVQVLAQTSERLELRSGAVHLTVFRHPNATLQPRRTRNSR